MAPADKRGIVAIAALAIIASSSIIVLANINSIYSTLPPLSECGSVPHTVPAAMQSLVSQIEKNPTFVSDEKGVSFRYSNSNLMSEQYYNGTTYAVSHILFVHIISNEKEDFIAVNITPNGNTTFAPDFNSQIECVRSVPSSQA